MLLLTATMVTPPRSSGGRGVGSVATDDHSGPLLVRFVTLRRIEVDLPDLTAQHRRTRSKEYTPETPTHIPTDGHQPRRA